MLNKSGSKRPQPAGKKRAASKKKTTEDWRRMPPHEQRRHAHLAPNYVAPISRQQVPQ